MLGPVRQTGLTVLEMLVAVAVMTLFLGVGAPSMNRLADEHRLAGSVEAVVSALATVRSEAASAASRLPVDLVVGDRGWCYGASRDSLGCDCTLTDPEEAAFCELVRGDWETHPKVYLTGFVPAGGGELEFGPTLSSARGGVLTLDSDGERQLQITVNRFGMTRVCVPGETYPFKGYTPCET